MFKCYRFRILVGTIRLLELYEKSSLTLLESFCSISFIRRKKQYVLRDGPLENLWGGWAGEGGVWEGGGSTKKIFGQGKIKWKKFLHAN